MGQNPIKTESPRSDGVSSKSSPVAGGSDSIMNHIRGVDRKQTLLLPEALDDYTAPENPVRILDTFVASLDLHTAFFR
jgi:hypothetical protein